jgi:adenylyltransferase/sulfurtransferase
MFSFFGGASELDQDPKEVKARLDRGEDLVLLDVREPWEVAVAKLEGAVQIPLGELGRRFHELDPEAEVVVYCHMGVRSMKAALFLRQQGFENVFNLAGGIDAWSLNVDPKVPRYR